ncbi:MAG: MFS transporter [Clostridiales bacterium]|jgi:GPH family glycoside/pentoside/hexuronide:cation symporter|nr:MFS transporter [Clostridiales bacterium]
MAAKPTKAWRYAVGMFGTSIPINIFKTYASIFYVDRMGMPIKHYSLTLLIYTFIDALDNPVYGFLSDRTRTKWGRRRPWLIVGAPALALLLIGFFSPPNIPNIILYFLPMYVLTGTIDSLINANYAPLFPELFKTQRERSHTNSMRQAFQLLAMIISIALTPIVTGAIGYQTTAIIYGLLGGAVIIFSALGCHENPDYNEMAKPRMWDSILSIAKNKHFWIAGIATAFYSAAMSLVMSAMPFYAKYALNISSVQTSILFATVLVVSIAFIWVWSRFLNKYEVVKVWRLALMFLGLAYLPLYFAGSFMWAVAAGAILAVGYGGVLATNDLIGARIIDEDASKYNQRREGIYSSVGGFLNRLNGLFTSLAFFLVSIIFGYESGDNPGANPASATRFLLALFPFILMILSAVFAMLLNFDDGSTQEHEQEHS